MKQTTKSDKLNGEPAPPVTSPTPTKESLPVATSDQTQAAPLRTPSPKVLNIVRSSKFRHIEGHMMHRSTQIDKIPKLSSTVPGDSNAFQVGVQRDGVMFPLYLAFHRLDS